MPENNDFEIGSHEWRQAEARRVREERYQSRQNVYTFFERLGYDITNNQDVERLAENLRFAERQRQRAEKMDSNKLGWVVSFVLLMLGAAASAMAQWFASRISPGK